jgi:nucleotide-binding universal stress UspA family protein
MPQKVLVAVDDSASSMKSVSFVAKTFSTACHVAVMSILRPVDLLCEMDPSALKGFLASHYPDYCREVDERHETALKSALSTARQSLIDAGFDETNVTVLLKTMVTDVALEIIDESRKGYDVIVLGRRGLSPVKGFFLGSVSQKVLSTAKEVSVLIVN